MAVPRRCRCVLPWPIYAAAVTFRAAAAFNLGENAPDAGSGYDNLVDWVRRNGGRVDGRLGFGTHAHDGHELRGGVALDDIEAGAELLFLPWRLVLGTDGDTATVSSDHCAVLRTYAAEIRAGERSFWHPYLNMDGSLGNEGARIPAAWDESVLGELQGLPPSEKEKSSRLTEWFSANCAGGVPFEELDEPTRRSLMAAVTRAAGMRFLPIFDLLNHHNGKLNTRSHADERGDTLTALKDIPKGEEIFLSYRGGTGSTTSEVFRRYGFIEPWPQQWAWTDPATSEEKRFLLLPGGTVAISPPDSMTSGIGTTAPPLREMRVDAEGHNSNLPAERLGRFERAGRGLLSSLPTTAAEDAEILAGLERDRSLLASRWAGEKETLRLGDRISAVAYRMHFKEAVRTAVDAAEGALKGHMNAGGEL